MSEVVVAQKEPFAVEVTEGKTYFWCGCGRSGNEPFCDGAHKGTGLEPIKWTASATETVHFCGCKHSGKKPFCDGSHSGL